MKHQHSFTPAVALPWHQTPAARAAIAAVVLAGEQPTHHRAVYAQTTDEFYSYEGPLAARVNALWADAFAEAEQAYREGDRDAYKAWYRMPKPDAAIDAAYAVRGL
jgi:hypothetical protein